MGEFVVVLLLLGALFVDLWLSKDKW